MQQVSKYVGRDSPYISLVVSKHNQNPNVTEMKVNVHSRFMSSSDITHSRFTETKLECSQNDQVKESSEAFNYICQNQCRNCLKWKNWAVKQEKGMLQLQKQLICKEQKLFEVIGRQKSQILTKAKRIEQLQVILQQKNQQIDRLGQQIRIVKVKCEQLSSNKVICETPKKQCRNVSKLDLQISLTIPEATKVSSLQNTDKIKNVTKTSAITTKAEGWQCQQTLKKEKVQRNINVCRANQLQRFIFENQTLKDYNSVLLEQIRAHKYKKGIC